MRGAKHQGRAEVCRNLPRIRQRCEASLSSALGSRMTDYRAKPLYDDEVRQFAKRLRAYFGVQDCCYVDVLTCMKRGQLLTHRGMQRLNYQVRPDDEMGINEGSTIFGRSVVTISVKKSVHETALLGVGRSRNTLAHELGHGVTGLRCIGV
jgi:hypothetical protein